MLLLLRASSMLVLATLLLRIGSSDAVSKKLGRGSKFKGTTVRLASDPSWQPETAGAFSSSVASMSLSPWTYRESFVESRLPRRISHAQCLTSVCRTLQGGGEDAVLEAKPILYQVLVLHRVQRPNKKRGNKARKKYVFVLGTEVVTVGCTCVRPSVVPQQERARDASDGNS